MSLWCPIVLCVVNSCCQVSLYLLVLFVVLFYYLNFCRFNGHFIISYMFIGATLAINGEAKVHPISRDSDGNQLTLEVVFKKCKVMR